MRKYILLICLSAFFTTAINAQINDEIAWEHVNLAKKELIKAKGEKRIDYLTLLANAYTWIWDDDDTHLDTACLYANQAYEEAKKSNYLKGIGYSKAALVFCSTPRRDNNRNNNDTEPAYKQYYKLRQEVLDIAKKLKDDYLAGIIYYEQEWMEKWWGSPDKYKANAVKAIEHFEKLSGNEFKDGVKPLMIVNCNGCKGTEAMLGYLHTDLAVIYSQENNPVAAKKEFEIALRNYKAAGQKALLGQTYSQQANFYYREKDYKSSEAAYLEAARYLLEAGSIEQAVRTQNELCKVYETNGEFEKGIHTSMKSLSLIEEHFKNKSSGSANGRSLGQVFFWMSRLYKIAGDYEGALQVIRRGRQFYPASSDSLTLSGWIAEIGDIHRLLGNYDSAMFYLKDFQYTDNNPNNFGKMHLGYLYNDLKEFSKALSLILPYYQNLKNIHRITPPIAQTLMIASNASLGKKNYEQALQYAKEAQLYLLEMDGRLLMISNNKLLSDIYSKLNKPDSAYKYLSLHTRLKDSLITRQFYFKLNSLKIESEEQKKTSQIRLLQKDYLIKEQELQQQILLKEQSEAQLTLLDKNNELKDQQLLIKDQRLKQQTLLKNQNESQLILSDKENRLKDERLKQQVLIRNALLGGLLLFILLGGFVFRNLSLKRKNEKLVIKKSHAEFQQKVAELEMQALRAQMNPHFIFNCLNSINRFIFMNETKVASDYLTRFSRLIRMVLLHSQKKLVPLEDELEMLKLYLEMERLRFRNAFDYHITTTNAVENAPVFIPPLLLQPFCENAIWHGLLHKEEQGHLKIDLQEEKGILYCTITDDGVGRKQAEAYKSKSAEKEKSLGLKITSERLSLLNQGSSGGTFYEIDDIRDEQGTVAGTRVKLQIHYKETAEEAITYA